MQTQTRQQSFLPSFPQLTAQCKREAACWAELLQNAPTPQNQRWVPPTDPKEAKPQRWANVRKQKTTDPLKMTKRKLVQPEEMKTNWEGIDKRATINMESTKGSLWDTHLPALCTLEPYWGLSWKSLSCAKRTTFTAGPAQAHQEPAMHLSEWDFTGTFQTLTWPHYRQASSSVTSTSK